MKNIAATIRRSTISGMPWRRILTVWAITLLAAAPGLGVYPVSLMNMMCFAIFAASFNLLLGYTGLLSFGHAAFFGGGAYVAGYAAKELGLTPELSVLMGTVAGTFLGLAMGVFAIKRKGIYFAMITLALAQMVYFLALQSPWTGGEDGLQSIPRGLLFGAINLNHPHAIYAFTFVLFVLALVMLERIVHSPFGQILKAIRENEARAISLGIDVSRYKLIAFTMSASLAGLAGGMKALVTQIASLTDIAWQTSGEAILMTVLGGIGTTLGPIVGAGLVRTLEDQLTSSGLPASVIIGIVFVGCVMAFRLGIVGEIEKRMLRKPSNQLSLKE
jgi:branched-chain amino acid transport system permease protein